MLNKNGLILLLCISINFLSINSNGLLQEQSDLSDDQVRLKKILKETAAYCDRIKNLALYYICKEKITTKENIFSRTTSATGLLREERHFQIRKIERQDYVYDYQLVKKSGKLAEKRILLEENGKKRNIKNAELKNIKYVSKYLVFGPVGFLSYYWQNFFNYEITGDDYVKGEKAIIISARPIKAMDENYNIGKIWVNADNYQILRIEWEPASIKDYVEEEITTYLGEFKQKVVWIVDYNVEKNGVRFPGQQYIQELFFNENHGYKAVKREISFRYDEYKFFIVETEVSDLKIKKSNNQLKN